MQGLRGGGDNIAILERIVEYLGRDKTACVRNISHQERAMFVRRLAEVRIVPVTRVRGSTTNDKTGLEDTRLLSETAVVDELRCGVETVREGLEVDR